MGIKSEVKEMFLKLATNDQSDEAFLLTSALMGCLPRPKGSIYEGWSINSFLFFTGSLFMGGFASFSVSINSNLSLIGRKR